MFVNGLKAAKSKLPVFKIVEISFKKMPMEFFRRPIGVQKMIILGGDLFKRFKGISKNSAYPSLLEKGQGLR